MPGLTPAERQRRSRAHKRGDHSLCDPERCDAVTEPVTAVTEALVTEPVTDPVLEQLGPRGRRLYREVLGDVEQPDARGRLLIEEAARTADRLDQLDRLLRGDASTWARIEVPDHGDREAELVVDKTMAEARAQQQTLARLLGEFRQTSAPAVKDQPAAQQPAGPQQGGGKLADLTARIAARRGAPAG